MTIRVRVANLSSFDSSTGSELRSWQPFVRQLCKAEQCFNAYGFRNLVGLFFWNKSAGKGGENVSFTIGKDGEVCGVAAFLIEADLNITFKDTVATGMVGCGVLGAVFRLPYIVENGADGYAEFCCTGVAWYFMVMPFEDVDQGRRTEVVIEFL